MMQVRESVHIAADPSTVWPFVADPTRQRLWNPKVVSVNRQQSGPVVSRERFEMVYCMSGRQRQSQVEVATCEPPRHVVFEHRSSWKGLEQIAQEAYQISESRGGVEVIQTIDLSQIAVPWPWRALIWFISRFGKAVEEPYLERLKRAVEQSHEPV
jgi:uncharacterized protein YndB with AHSA1/START domain